MNTCVHVMRQTEIKSPVVSKRYNKRINVTIQGKEVASWNLLKNVIPHWFDRTWIDHGWKRWLGFETYTTHRLARILSPLRLAFAMPLSNPGDCVTAVRIVRKATSWTSRWQSLGTRPQINIGLHDVGVAILVSTCSYTCAEMALRSSYSLWWWQI